MKAIVKKEAGEGHVEYTDVVLPELQPNEVLIDVAFAGICGTDIKILHGTTWSNPPVILGHEYSGIVSAVGSDVKHVAAGDRVVSETAQHVCGHCRYCMSGDYLMCSERLSIGYGVNGAFASQIAVRAEIVHKIPSGVTLREAALAEPAAVAFHAVSKADGINPSDVVLVFGPGPIGLFVAQIAILKGARVCVLGLSSDRKRLAFAKELGAEKVIELDSSQEDLVSQYPILKDTAFVFDCSGTQSAVSLGLTLLNRNGELVQVGLARSEMTIPYGLLTAKQLRIKGTFGHVNKDWHAVLRMMASKQLEVASFVTDEYSLESWERAFDMAERREGIKILLTPTHLKEEG